MKSHLLRLVQVCGICALTFPMAACSTFNGFMSDFELTEDDTMSDDNAPVWWKKETDAAPTVDEEFEQMDGGNAMAPQSDRVRRPLLTRTAPKPDEYNIMHNWDNPPSSPTPVPVEQKPMPEPVAVVEPTEPVAISPRPESGLTHPEAKTVARKEPIAPMTPPKPTKRPVVAIAQETSRKEAEPKPTHSSVVVYPLDEVMNVSSTAAISAAPAPKAISGGDDFGLPTYDISSKGVKKNETSSVVSSVPRPMQMPSDMGMMPMGEMSSHKMKMDKDFLKKIGPAEKTFYFAHGSSFLTDAEKTDIAIFAKSLQLSPNSRITLVGHASKSVPNGIDAVSQDTVNLAMSMKRAKAVAEELYKAGVNPDIIKTVSWGDAKPNELQGQSSQEAANRRVEIYVHEKWKK